MQDTQGLAQSIAGPVPQQAPQQGGVPSVEEVVNLLMQGIPPEELEASGVPPEVIMQAIQILEQQMSQQQGAQPQPDPAQMGGGLAQEVVGL